MAYNVTLIRGDGTGPELARAAKRVLDATGVPFNWEEVDAGLTTLETEGTPLPDSVLESVRRNKVALKGPITTPIGSGFRSVNVALRKELDLYACLRPCKTYAGVRSRFDSVDLVVVRENTEDLYAGVEYPAGSAEANTIAAMAPNKIRPGAAISIKPISREGTERIARFAFEYARSHGRKLVTAVTKANIMKCTDGLFYEVSREVASQYPDIEYNERLIDNLCMQLVQRPEEYDVLLLPNLYGDIISDLCAGLVGGLGVAPGANLGDGCALFEPVHGSAPKYTGQDRVNPTALILSGLLMLQYLGEKEAADRLERAVAQVLAEGRKVTYDLKPTRDDPSAVGTQAMADAIIEAMQHD